MSIAAVTLGSSHKQAAPASSGVAISDSLGRVASSVLTTLYSSDAVATTDDQSFVPDVSTTLVARLSSTTIAPTVAPAVVALQRSDDSTRSVAAVVIDDGTVWAVAADIAGADHLEATVGSDKVILTVDVADPETGLVQLHPAKPLVLTPAASVAWLGVNCSDEYVNRSPVAPAAGDGARGAPTTDALVTTTIAATTSPTASATGRSPSSTASASSATTSPATTTRASTTIDAAPQPTIARLPSDRSAIESVPTPSSAATAAGPVTTTLSPGPSTVGTVVPTTVVDDFTPVTSTALTPADDSPSSSTVVWPQGDPASAGSHMRGVHVRDVVGASPADKGGLRRGDVILSADGRPVRTIWALVLAVRRHAIGDEINVLVRRNGNLMTLHMVLGSRPDGST